jgi:hypothetical protein
MSCHHPLAIFLVAAPVACGPSAGDSTAGSTADPGETSTGEQTTIDEQPTTTGDGTTTLDATTGDTTGDDTTAGEPGACDVAQGDHAAVCRGPDCAIEVDLEIRCHDRDFASRGMGVAPAPDATWLVTGSYFTPLLFRADAGGAAQIAGVIDDYTDKTLLMTQGPDGAPHIAVDGTHSPNWEDGLRHLTLVDGSWTDSLVVDDDKFLTPFDVEVDSQGRPHVFYDGISDSSFSAAVLDGGTWTTHLLDSPGPWTHFVLGPDDQEIVLGAPDHQLRAFVDGQTVELGSTLPQFAVHYQAATAATGPILAAALQLGDALEIAWWPDPAAVAIPGTSAVGDACAATDADGPDDTCPGPCHDDAVGMFPEAFSFTRTADGVGWLAWLATHRDLDAHYQLTELEGAYFCQSIIDRDDSVGMLHLVRVPLGPGAPTDVLTLPVSDLAGGLYDNGYPTRRSPVVLEASGSDLALALRLRGDEPPYQELPYARLLRIDTTRLP